MALKLFKHQAKLDAEWASTTMCLRRGTAARIVTPHGGFWRAMNAPVLSCTNMVGNCGCQHAEPRVIAKMLHESGLPPWKLTTLVTLSPCTACANLLVGLKRFDGVYWLRPLVHDLRGLRILEAAGIWHQQL